MDILSFSYQCSQLSTPESIADVFKNASTFQERQDRKSYVAVVVLDEVGLAEDSPNLPLKVLHPLLEDGTEGANRWFEDQPKVILCTAVLIQMLNAYVLGTRDIKLA